MLYISVLARGPPAPGETKCHVSCVHFRETKGSDLKNFTKWDSEGFMGVLKHFVKFLEQAGREYNWMTFRKH